jgi:cell division septum initiation protein DivIVA
MKRFGRELLGYRKGQVDRYVKELKKEYEKELGLKRDRIVELNDTYREAKRQMEELKLALEEYRRKENSITQALMMAEEKGRSIIRQSNQKADEAAFRIRRKQEIWARREENIRNKMLDLERLLFEMMEKFQTDITILESERGGVFFSEDVAAARDTGFPSLQS